MDKLPVEVKTLIARHCAEADLRYRARRKRTQASEELRKRRWHDLVQSVGTEWGQSLSGLSRVDHVWYSICVPLLFTTLRITRSGEDIYRYSIFRSPAGDAITTIVFSDIDREPIISTFLLHLLPFHPKINRIVGLKEKHLSTLFGALGLTNTLPGSIIYPRIRKLRQALLDLASQVTEWDVAVSADALNALLASSGYDSVRSLKFASPRIINPILEESDSPFVTILDKCTSLSSLTITQKCTLPTEETPQIHPDILLRPFSFQQSLRSLTFDTYQQRFEVDFDLLLFATSFPLLEHLCLPSDTVGKGYPAEDRTIRLPTLTHLEIACAVALEAVDSLPELLYCALDLPLLSRLDVKDGSGEPAESHYRLDHQIDHADELARLLEPWKGTLRVINIESGLTISGVVLRRLKGICRNIKFDWMPGTHEAHTDLIANAAHYVELEVMEDEITPEERSERYRECDGTTSRRLRDAAFDAETWLKEYVGQLNEREDDRGYKELLQLLEPVAQLKKWMED